MVNDTALAKLHKSSESYALLERSSNETSLNKNVTQLVCVFKQTKKNHFDGTFTWPKEVSLNIYINDFDLL